jgi:formylglycine-generating enzyme required for sulfatase activity
MRMRYVLLALISLAVLIGAEPQPAATTDTVAKPAWASASGKDQYGTWADLVVKGVTQRFRLIPGGTFTMGCDDAESNAAWLQGNKFPEKANLTDFLAPQLIVVLSHSYWMADSTCTQELWTSVMGSNPSMYHDNKLRPVEEASWNDCMDFLDKVKQLVPDLQIRLPTEAEWEYACRAGTKTALYTGDIVYIGRNNVPSLDSIAWYSGNSGIDDPHILSTNSSSLLDMQYPNDHSGTHPVRQKLPNAWGLYDMIGNVAQLCSDWFGPYPSDKIIDPSGSITGSERVTRGTSFYDFPNYCRSASRSSFRPRVQSSINGFRLCISAKPDKNP